MKLIQYFQILGWYVPKHNFFFKLILLPEDSKMLIHAVNKLTLYVKIRQAVFSHWKHIYRAN